jgi:RNA recognition motif. (a.k.a. RRM, RBD, or RNP domain)
VHRKTLSFKKSMQYLSLHVKGFPRSDNVQQDVMTYFSGFGQVKTVKITTTGAALVSFHDRETAKRAKDQSQDAQVGGCQLDVSYFEPRELRQLHMAQEQDKRACEMKRQRDLFPSALGPLDANSNISGIFNALGALLNLGNGGGLGYQRSDYNSGGPRGGYGASNYQGGGYQQRGNWNGSNPMNRRPPMRRFYNNNG